MKKYVYEKYIHMYIFCWTVKFKLAMIRLKGKDL